VSIDASPEAGKKSYKNIKIKNTKITVFHLHISPLCRVSPVGPIFYNFWRVGSYRRRKI